MASVDADKIRKEFASPPQETAGRGARLGRESF